MEHSGRGFLACYVVTTCLVLFTCVLRTAIPWWIGRVLESTAGAKADLEREVNGLLVLIASYGTLRFFSQMAAQALAEGLSRRLRKIAFDRLLQADPAFIMTKRTGEMVGRVIRDIKSLKDSITQDFF